MTTIDAPSVPNCPPVAPWRVPATAGPTRIVVADDHTLLREALCESLLMEEDFTVCGVASDGAEVPAVASRTQPDIVLLDLDMPAHDPLRSVVHLRSVAPGAKVIVLTMHDRSDIARALLDAGACGYLSKSVSRQHLVTTIRSVREGNVVTVAAFRPGVPAAAVDLSAREIEVLALVAEAMSNRQIGRRLNITEGTVKRHLRNTFEKLGVTSRMAAVRAAGAAGVLHPSRLAG